MNFDIWWDDVSGKWLHYRNDRNVKEIARLAWDASREMVKYCPGGQVMGVHGGGMGTNVTDSGIEQLPGPSGGKG